LHYRDGVILLYPHTKSSSHLISSHRSVRLDTINVLTSLRPHFMRTTDINPADISKEICYGSLQYRWTWKKIESWVIV